MSVSLIPKVQDSPVGSGENIRRIPQGMEMDLPEFTGEKIRATFLRPDILRLQISVGGVFDENPSHAVAPGMPFGEPTSTRILEKPGCVQIHSGSMEISLFSDPFHVEIRRSDGSLVLGSSRGPDGHPWFYRRAGEGFETGRTIQDQDGIYGLGEKTGSFNKNGRAWKFWNTDVLNPSVAGGYPETPHEDPMRDPTSVHFDPYYVSIPFYLHRPSGSAQVAGFFLNNLGRSSFDFSKPGEGILRFETGSYEEFVFAGPGLPEVMRGYSGLTGRIPLPPLWALGNHQCRWHDYSQEQVEALGRKYREAKLPCDVLWIDIDYMNEFRVFTWDAQKFPRQGDLIQNLQAQKLRLITIIDPGIKEEPGYPVYDEAIRDRLVCLNGQGEPYVGQVWPGKTVFPDFTLAETRQWWGMRNAEHVRSGIAGIWNDMNEPATGEVPAEGMLFGHGQEPHERFHNEYALLMAMGTVEGLRKAMPDKRTFVLTRAGSPGIQRYAANWLGDNCSRWEHLGLAIRMTLGMGLSGQPFVGADVGGFMGTCSEELLTRWYQYAAFTPFCRNHNAKTQPDQYPWSFGPQSLDSIRQALVQRYQLMPYLYSQFVIASESGLPVQRPLCLEFPGDLKTWEIEDQFLLGAHLLVAPVLEPGCLQRSSYLPRGIWYSWPDHQPHISEGAALMASSPLDRIPVWVRGGAVIPCWPETPLSTMDYHPEEIVLHVYLPEDGSQRESLLQEDDGLTDAHRTGKYFRTQFRIVREQDRFRLWTEVEGRGFPEFRRQRFRVFLHPPSGEHWVLESRSVTDSGDWEIPNRGEEFELEGKRVE